MSKAKTKRKRAKELRGDLPTVVPWLRENASRFQRLLEARALAAPQGLRVSPLAYGKAFPGGKKSGAPKTKVAEHTRRKRAPRKQRATNGTLPVLIDGVSPGNYAKGLRDAAKALRKQADKMERQAAALER